MGVLIAILAQGAVDQSACRDFRSEHATKKGAGERAKEERERLEYVTELSKPQNDKAAHEKRLRPATLPWRPHPSSSSLSEPL